jgi:hypothetical protein
MSPSDLKKRMKNEDAAIGKLVNANATLVLPAREALVIAI